MIAFDNPPVLWLAVPWLAFLWLFGRLQRRALAWLELRVSARFRPLLTVYDRRRLRVHLALLGGLGLLLVAAAAGPTRAGRAEGREAAGRVLLLVDASASMYAEDMEGPVTGDARPASRMAAAREIARALVAELEGWRFALASFSGQAVVHLPMIRDRELLDDALSTLEAHTFYRGTGSSFTRALDLVSHFARRDEPPLQVVLLSDGEMPYREDFEAPLEVLAAQQVPIHAVAIGSERGQKRVIFDFSDVVAKVEEPRVLRRYHTRRVDRHLERMADRTGGSFAVAAPGVVASTAGALRRLQRRTEVIEHRELRDDLTVWPLLVFLAGFLLDGLGLWRRPSSPAKAFDVTRLGPPRGGGVGSAAGAPTEEPRRSRATRAAIAGGGLVLLLASCGGTPRQLAHRENELGIALDRVGRHAAARPHYERSAGLEVLPQIPTYNLARSITLAGDFSEAHDVYQQALRLDPELVEAHYNDGVNLYRWGAAERDPQDCRLERTENLWSQALRRFATAARLAPAGSEPEARAHRNRRFLEAELAAVRELIRRPPPHCAGASSQAPGAGGGSEEEDEEDPERDGGGGGGPGGGGRRPGEEGEEAGQGAGAGDGDGGDEEEDGDREGEDGEGEGDGGEEPGDEDEGAGGTGDEEEAGGGGGGEDEGGGQDGDGEGGGEGGGDGDREGEDGEDEGEGGEPRQGDGDGGGGGDLEAGDGPGGLTPNELETIRRELGRIAEQAAEEGKFHRRTLPEQFPQDAWKNPEDVIWW